MHTGNEQQFWTERRRYVHIGDRNGRYRSHFEAGTQTFAFGPYRFVPHARLLERGGSPTSLGGRAFDLLCLLVGRPGQVVSKDELIARTWPNATVEESCLRFHIAQLRRALRDQGSERYIVTVPGRGYCFVASVTREALPLAQRYGKSPAGSALRIPAVRP